jgi:hypothetical protein
MAYSQIDPASLQGDALTQWYRRSPEEIEQARQAATTQRYNDFFGWVGDHDPDPGFGIEVGSAGDIDPGFSRGVQGPAKDIDPGFSWIPVGPNRWRSAGSADPDTWPKAAHMPSLELGPSEPGIHPVPMPTPWKNWERRGPRPVSMAQPQLDARQPALGGSTRTSGNGANLTSPMSNVFASNSPPTTSDKAPPVAGGIQGQGAQPNRSGIIPRLDPTRTDVFQPGPDGKLYPIPGWHTTGPFDVKAWNHNIDWGGVARDLGTVASGAGDFLAAAGWAGDLLGTLGPKVAPAVTTGIKEAIERHHSLPKFMGGRVDQDLVDLYQSLHRKFHGGLAEALGDAGFPRVGGKGGGTWNWAQHFNDNPGSYDKATGILRQVTRDFDKTHGTSISPYLERELGITPPKPGAPGS